MTNLPNATLGQTIVLAIVRTTVLATVLATVLTATGCNAIGTRLGIPLAAVTPAPRDHYDPAYLNDAAVAAWSRGERATALLLLERAAVIAPQDRRILDNLGALKRAGSHNVLMHYGSLPDRGAASVLTGTATLGAGTAQAPTQTVPAPIVPAPAAPEVGLWPLK